MLILLYRMSKNTYLAQLNSWSPAGGNNATGSSFTNLTSLYATFEELPDQQVRMTLNGKVTLTCGTTAGVMTYNGYFNAGGDPSVNPLPEWAIPACDLYARSAGLMIGAYLAPVATTLTGPMVFYFSRNDNWPECVFSISAWPNGTALSATDITFKDVSFVYKKY